ncbi:MAG: FtsW/RodA/SpoVE family cell cycle protein [Clostridiales Family XIII bacterium]|jgi:rod shape determining protein RodA|nr:FtsW/RodA/SpoVE family cell cycle protein [Clostridiales Family XIII bacterium]
METTLLDKLKKIDVVLVAIPALLGVISVFIINSVVSGYSTYPRPVVVQAISFALGYALMMLAARFDVEHFSKFYRIIWILSILIQLLVFIPGLSDTRGGQSAWIDLGFTTIQPSELVKITFVISLAAYLRRHREELATLRGFIRAFMFAIPIIGLVAYIDMGAGIVVAIIFIGMVFAAGIRGWLFLRITAVVVLIFPIGYRFLQDYQTRRFQAWMNPDDLTLDEAWQLYQSKLAIGSGGIMGKGLGNGTMKEFLPVAESDFIFSMICEELGLLGGIACIVLLFLLLTRIWRAIADAKEYFSGLLCVGFMCMFGFQIFENIGMTIGVMPITGITLPFLSSGGTSVMANMIAIGLIVGCGMRSRERTYKHVDSDVPPGIPYQSKSDLMRGSASRLRNSQQ